jgi:hypothetical protein
MRNGGRPRSTLLRIGLALAPLAGAFATVPVAWAIDWLACEEETSEACTRQDLADSQHVLAWVGLVPALVFTLAFLTRRRRLAWPALAAAVAVYAAWALLADAAVHGWDDLVLVPL